VAVNTLPRSARRLIISKSDGSVPIALAVGAWIDFRITFARVSRTRTMLRKPSIDFSRL
jgi:hypothetical protein